VTAVADALSAVTTPGNVMDLPEYQLTVIHVPDAGNGRAAATTPAEAVRAYVEASPELTAGPPVYEATDAAPKGGLIPIGEVVVKFKPTVSEEARRRLLSQNNLEVRRTDYPEPGAILAATKNGRDVVAIANALHESDQVEFAQPNFVHLMPRLAGETNGGGVAVAGTPGAVGEDPMAPIVETRMGGDLTLPRTPFPAVGPSAPPTDPSFSSQWGLVKIKAPEAFDITMGNSSISVAIIDEGCDLAHEDIEYKTPGYDAYDGDDAPQPNGSDAHGTSCAGIAASKANNGLGGSGVAPLCKVLPIRIAQGVGGGFWDTTDAKVADGIRKAVDRGADVLSNSYQVGQSTVVTSAFQYAQTNGRGGKGSPIAAATGNGDSFGVIYPARLSPTIPGFLAVGASNEWDQRKSSTSLDGETWWGSNYGPEVDVVAPGVHIFATDITGGAGYSGGNYVPNFNGTSSATPHVAGLMALILSVDPDLRSWEVEDIVKLTADDLGPAGRDDEFGFGRINCRRALEAASRLWYQISVTPEFIGTGRECFMRVNVRMYNSGINTVRLDELTLTSHSPDWSTEIDRCEYRPNPGGMMPPRAGHDLRLNGLLLKANGNEASWSYNWALSWSYTFWRPSAPFLPLAGGLSLIEAEGRKSLYNQVRGRAEKPQRSGMAPARMTAPASYASPMHSGNGSSDASGDRITVDRQTREITIVIR
jgi:hypothetical protein